MFFWISDRRPMAGSHYCVEGLKGRPTVSQCPISHSKTGSKSATKTGSTPADFTIMNGAFPHLKWLRCSTCLLFLLGDDLSLITWAWTVAGFDSNSQLDVNWASKAFRMCHVRSVATLNLVPFLTIQAFIQTDAQTAPPPGRLLQGVTPGWGLNLGPSVWRQTRTLTATVAHIQCSH